MSTPFLCKLGFHQKYNYLPKVGGDLGEISIACKKCGMIYAYFDSKWRNAKASEIEDSVKKQAEIEYGRVLCRLGHNLPPLVSMEMALNIIRNKFTEDELKPITEDLEDIRERNKRLGGQASSK